MMLDQIYVIAFKHKHDPEEFGIYSVSETEEHAKKRLKTFKYSDRNNDFIARIESIRFE